MEDQKPVEVQKKLTMILIAMFIGWTGVHKKMMGYPKWWLNLLLTPCFGIGYLMGIIDFWRLVFGNLKMADGRELE
jgi:hypothetical protein